VVGLHGADRGVGVGRRVPVCSQEVVRLGQADGDDVVGREDGHGAVPSQETVHAVEDHELAVPVVAAAEAGIAVRVHLAAGQDSVEESRE
jgi:hypothetical protein